VFVDSNAELTIKRMGKSLMFIEIANTLKDGTTTKASIHLGEDDLYDLQRDIYSYLKFGKNV
jgi:hypothetical protein